MVSGLELGVNDEEAQVVEDLTLQCGTFKSSLVSGEVTMSTSEFFGNLTMDIVMADRFHGGQINRMVRSMARGNFLTSVQEFGY